MTERQKEKEKKTKSKKDRKADIQIQRHVKRQTLRQKNIYLFILLGYLILE